MPLKYILMFGYIYIYILMHSGHRIGTAEVESALASHPQCAEAAVVGVEHEVCGVIIINGLVKEAIGPH